jgi:hypothetical protein
MVFKSFGCPKNFALEKFEEFQYFVDYQKQSINRNQTIKFHTFSNLQQNQKRKSIKMHTTEQVPLDLIAR